MNKDLVPQGINNVPESFNVDEFKRMYVSYDINFTINLCKSILDHINLYRFKNEKLTFSLRYSLTNLLAYLETERDQMILRQNKRGDFE